MQCQEEIGLASESSLKACASKGKSMKTTIPIKPSYVLLKNVSHEIKEKHEYCLIPANAKELPPKIQNKAAVFKKLQVALYDFLDKSYIKKPKKPHKIENAEALLENENMNKMERGLELNSSVTGLSSGRLDSGGGNTDNETNKTERPNSLDISNLCDQGIFARFSFMESNCGKPFVKLGHVQTSEKETGSLQIDSVLIPETQMLKTKSFEPAEMFIECENNLVKQAERKETFDKREQYGDLKISTRFSGEASTDNTSQFSKINRICISHRETLQANQINPACSSETLFSGIKFSKTSIRHMEALPDKTSHEGEMYQAIYEFDKPPFVCPLTVQDLNLDMKDMIPGKFKGNMSTERIVSDPKTLAEKALDAQLDVEEQGMPNQNNPVFRNKDRDTCLFLLETDEIMDEEVHVRVTDEEKFRELERGDVSLDRGTGFPQSESKSTCLSLLDDVTLKHIEVGEGAMPTEPKVACDGETSNTEESVNPQPAEENTPVGEEESLQPRQPQGVQMVFYELVGSKVKLLGTPSDSSQMFSLEKLIELNDSSDNEENQSNHANMSLSNKKGKLHSVNKSLNLDGSRTKKKRRQRPDKTPAPVYTSQLSQGQSRIKVVDALRRALQKRLDNFPDLNVPKNTVSKIAKEVEREIFKLFCCVNQHYKTKYRSLLFNLKSTENQHLFRKVLLGEIAPKSLVQLSSLELAPKELAEWRAKENKRMLEIIEKEAREAPKCCSAKFTHKGIVEIHREANEDLSFQEIFVSQLLKEGNCSCEISAAPVREPSKELSSHLRGSGYFSSGQMTADSDRGFKPPTYKCTLNQKGNAMRRLAPSTMYSEGGGRRLQEESPTSPGVPKKHRRVEKPSETTAIWKGLIQMFSVKQFLAEAYPVSGSSCHLCQGLPHLLPSRGCILPEEVWAYLDSIWPANRKEMGVIRFCPSLSKGVNPYNILYSYLNNKQRYGIVDSNQMEIFMVPLAACQPVPSKLHALGGPGLDPSHSSLLLGLILPKRTCPLEPRPNPKPKPKRKSDTFKESTEAKCLALSLSSEEDDSRRWPPWQLPIDRLLCGNEVLLTGLPGQEPLPVDALLVLMEEIGGEILHREPSSLHHKEAEDEANRSPFGDASQSFSGSPWTGGQLGNWTLENLGAQPGQDGDRVQFCMDSDPSHFWDTLGLLLPSEEQHGAGRENNFEDPFLPSMFCAKAVVPGEMTQAWSSPQIKSAGEPSSLMEETLSLIQHVMQLQSHFQNQELQPTPAFCLPFVPQESTSALSPGGAGFKFPQVQLGDGTLDQLQLLLSTLRGQTQSSSTV